jgi:hypothetical protein
VPTYSVVIDDQNGLFEGHEDLQVITSGPRWTGVGPPLPSRRLLGIYGRVSRVPPHASGGSNPPGGEDIEQLEELGDDAIIAQQRGAHAPAPRAHVMEEARSVVISDHPGFAAAPAAANAGVSPRKRSERTEKTVVIRDRRQIEELRREMAKRKPPPVAPPQTQGLLLWVIVGVAAFLTGGLVALFATRDESTDVAPIPPVASQASAAAPPAPSAAEPPSVSIDELPIEGSKKH